MNCTNCGAPLPEGAKFCTSCGAVLGEAPAAPAAAPAAKKAGIGNLVAAAIALMLGIFMVCHYLAAVIRFGGDSDTQGWGIFNMIKCGKDLDANGGFFAVLVMIFGIIALLAIIGAIFTLVTKNPLGWTLFKAALVLVIITFVFTFIYGLFCSGSASWKMLKGFGAKGSLGPSFGAWFSFCVSVLSLIGLKKIKEL